MSIAEIESDIWNKLGTGQGLTKDQENFVIGSIHTGGSNFSSLSNVEIISLLRTNSNHLRDKSYDEMFKVVDSLKHLMLNQASDHLETAVQSEWQGAKVNAQANRIENAEIQQRAAQEALKALQIEPIRIPLAIQPPPMPKMADLPLTFNGKMVFVYV